MRQLKFLSASLLYLTICIYSDPLLFFGENNISLCSWNLKDFGKTKSDLEIEFIATTVKDFDIVLIQEVVAKDPGGAQAVGRLGDALNRKGAKWDYRYSDGTSGTSGPQRERYAYLWKTSKVKLVGKPWLEIKYNVEIEREPYYATFRSGNTEFTLLNYHAIPKDSQPEKEVKYLKYMPEEFPNLKLVFCGDFNLPEKHNVFNPLKGMGYLPVLTGQKTSLKKEYKGGECLSSELDNIFYPSSKFRLIKSGVIHFYKSFSNFKEATDLTDHVPVYVEFQLK